MATSKIKGSYELTRLMSAEFADGAAHDVALTESVTNFEYVIGVFKKDQHGSANTQMIPVALFKILPMGMNWFAANSNIYSLESITYKTDTTVGVTQGNVTTWYRAELWGYRRVKN